VGACCNRHLYHQPREVYSGHQAVPKLLVVNGSQETPVLDQRGSPTYKGKDNDKENRNCGDHNRIDGGRRIYGLWDSSLLHSNV